MINILIDMPVYEPLLNVLNGFPDVNVKIIKNTREEARLLPEEQIKDCEVLFCTTPPVNHRLMSHLRMIQISSTGYNQVVGERFEENGVKVCNARGVFDVPIAEWNIAMMINLCRDVRSLIRNQDQSIWDRSSHFQREIRNSVVGIWGYGGIGRETTRLAKSLGMKVHVLSRSKIRRRANIFCVAGTGDVDGKLPDRVYLLNEKEDFLSELDFLIMAIPLTKDTVGILGEAELKLLPHHAFLLNPARGPLVDEQSLIKYLRKKYIAGAALDTHYHYPLPPEHPLWSMPNVILTPHISGSSSSTRFLERIWDIFIQNIKRLQNHETLLNELSTLQLRG